MVPDDCWVVRQVCDSAPDDSPPAGSAEDGLSEDGPAPPQEERWFPAGCPAVLLPDDCSADSSPDGCWVASVLAGERDDLAARESLRRDARSQRADCPADSWADS